MIKIQIAENESMLQFADFNKYKVWLLNKTTSVKLGDDVINIPEITESLESSADKFPALLGEIYSRYGDDIDYQVLATSTEHFARKIYTCDYDKIKTFTLK